MLVKKIRDYINGNTVNTGNHWCRILIYTEAGSYLNSSSVSLAAYDGNGNAATWAASSGSPNDFMFNPSVASDPYAYSSEPGLRYVEATLSAETDIQFIRVVHYFAYGRTYYSTKVTVQNTASGSNWITIFDSATNGTYVESSLGLYLRISGNMPTPSIKLDNTQYTDLRTLIYNYWAAPNGASSNGSLALTSPSPGDTDNIKASDISTLLADVRRLYTSPTGTNNEGAITSYIQNGSYVSAPTAPSQYSIQNHAILNSIRSFYGFLTVNCFVCNTAKMTCSACNGTNKVSSYCAGCNTTCVTSNNPYPCNNCVNCQSCYSTCYGGN